MNNTITSVVRVFILLVEQITTLFRNDEDHKDNLILSSVTDPKGVGHKYTLESVSNPTLIILCSFLMNRVLENFKFNYIVELSLVLSSIGGKELT